MVTGLGMKSGTKAPGEKEGEEVLVLQGVLYPEVKAVRWVEEGVLLAREKAAILSQFAVTHENRFCH